MVWRLYKYRFKRLINDKTQLFWLAVFPVILGTFFWLAFSEISSKTENLEKIPIVVIKESAYPNEAALDIFLEAMSGKDGMLAILPADSDERAEEMLEEGKIDGILWISESLDLEFQENGMNQTILKHMIDRYLQSEYVLIQAGERGAAELLAAASALAEEAAWNEEQPISSGDMDPYVQYYFALMAMCCMYGSSLGLLNTQEIQADQTKVACRRCVSPVKKGQAVLTDFLAAFTIQMGIFLILYAYLTLVLKISFGNNFGYIAMAGAASIFNGIAFGYLIGVGIKGRETVKNAVMTTVVLALSFLAGLMLGEMKFVVEKNIPIINRINPAALSSDCFYYLCIFNNKERYWNCIFILLAETLLFGVLSAFVLKKEKYRSI